MIPEPWSYIVFLIVVAIGVASIIFAKVKDLFGEGGWWIYLIYVVVIEGLFYIDSFM